MPTADIKTEVVTDNTHRIDGLDNELLIIDEADHFLFDRPHLITGKYIVGLTATALDQIHDNVAKDFLLNTMKFKVYESNIGSKIDAN